MMYDWKKINDDFKLEEFRPLKTMSMIFPTFDLFNIDESDYAHMQHMISCNIIIPITFEEDNGKDTDWLIED